MEKEIIEQLKKIIPTLKWSDDTTNSIGAKFGEKFLIIACKGHGGFGCSLSVKDLVLNETVYFKFSNEDDKLVELAYKHHTSENKKSHDEFIELVKNFK
jgi:hypothetical protein